MSFVLTHTPEADRARRVPDACQREAWEVRHLAIARRSDAKHHRWSWSSKAGKMSEMAECNVLTDDGLNTFGLSI